MRYLIKFSKESDIKFIGHLDLMKTIQRMLKRSGLPIEYSKGFNPHINVSLAQPLSVGAYSTGDYMEASFEKPVDENLIKEKLNEAAPMGIKIFEVVPIKDVENQKLFKAMAVLDGAKYTVTVKYLSTDSLEEDIKRLLNLEQWRIVKKSKSKEAEVDIKSMVKEFNYKIDNNTLIMNVIISCGSRENLSPELLAKYIQQNTSNSNLDAFVDVKREEMYASKNKKLLPLYKFAKTL